jgi:hypothetical protein
MEVAVGLYKIPSTQTRRLRAALNNDSDATICPYTHVLVSIYLGSEYKKWNRRYQYHCSGTLPELGYVDRLVFRLLHVKNASKTFFGTVLRI